MKNPAASLGRVFRHLSSVLNARTVRAEDEVRAEHRGGSLAPRVRQIAQEAMAVEAELD